MTAFRLASAAQPMYGAVPPMVGPPGRGHRRRTAARVAVGAAVAAAAALGLVALAGAGARPSVLDAVSTIGNDAPTSIATAQPAVTGVPFGFDPATGATQFVPMPAYYAAGLPAPGTGVPGNAYVPSDTRALALNTYQPYPYGPLPYGQVNPLVPYPQYATAPLTPYGMLQPAQTKIEITDNKDPVTVTVPQQPDWVNFPSVMLDPDGAPFGSTPNTAAAYNEYASSVQPGVTFIPQVNYTFIRNFPIMPNIPPPVDLFTGTGPSGEAPYHIVGSVLSEQPKDGDFDTYDKTEITGASMKQSRLQQLVGRSARRTALFRNLKPTPEQQRQQHMRDEIFKAMPPADSPEEQGTRAASMSGWEPPVYVRKFRKLRRAPRAQARSHGQGGQQQQLYEYHVPGGVCMYVCMDAICMHAHTERQHMFVCGCICNMYARAHTRKHARTCTCVCVISLSVCVCVCVCVCVYMCLCLSLALTVRVSLSICRFVRYVNKYVHACSFRG